MSSASAKGDLIIGVDAGTSLIKAVAFDLDGAQLAVGSVRTQLHYRDDGGVEQGMAWTWQALGDALRALAGKLPKLAARCAALSITGQGDGTWLVDASGEPLTDAWLWLDGRAATITRRLRASPAGKRICEITGTGLNPSMQSVQLLAMQTSHADALARAQHALHCKDWLYFKATGRIATDLSEGNFTYGNYRTRRYDDEVLELLGLNGRRGLLPPMTDPAASVAPLTQAAALATGLAQGTPVVLAPMDVPATVMGAGGVEPGRNVGCSILGSTGMHARMHAAPEAVRPLDQVGYTMCMPMVPMCGAMMSHMAASLNVDWLLQLVRDAQALGGAQPDAARTLASLEGLVERGRPGRLLYHPFICDNGERGPFVNPAARAQLIGLTASSTLADLARGIYEGIAFAARDCFEAIGMPDEVRLSGGVAKSGAMRRILAAALNRPIRVSRREEAGAAGAALSAAVALGHSAGYEAAIADWSLACLAPETTTPDPLLAADYAALFPIYRQSYAALAPSWDALAEQRAGSSTRKHP